MVANDPKNKITDALTDPELRTDMLTNMVSKEQKRFDTALEFGSTVYSIPHYQAWLLTDRRQQMAMKSKGIKPRSEQLTEAMVASQDKIGISAGTRQIDDYMTEKKKRQG